LTSPSRLRYGLLVERPTLSRWQLDVIESLEAVEGVELCVLVQDGGEHRRPTVRELSARKLLAWTVFNRLASRRSPATRSQPLPARFGAVPRVVARIERSGAWSEFASTTLRDIEAHRPDFLLRFGSTLIRGGILDVSPLGVWSFHHGDEQTQRGGPPCFWEIVDGDPLTGVLLQRLNDRIDAGVPLARAWFRTVSHSYPRNRDQAYLGATELPAQVCRRILADGPEAVSAVASSTTAPIRRPPSGRTLARILPKLVLVWTRQQMAGLTKSDRWHVGVVDRPVSSFLTDPSTSDVRWLPRPKGSSRYLADPFGCETRDGITVLVEDYDHRDRHGRISAYELPTSGAPRGPLPVRSFDDHASYPSLTRVGDQWWCIPETARAGEVRAHRFDPTTAQMEELEPLLPDVAVSDPTLFEWDGRWWLFGTDYVAGANSHLRAWWAEDPAGPWCPHAIDPLLIDVRSARPAGSPFVLGGELYRPAQDCSVSYGGAVVLNRVTRLDPWGFEEEPAARVEPDPEGPYPDGVHTLSGVGDVTLIDGTRHRFSVRAFAHELSARLRRFRPARR
jgi:hypothetical protein